MNEEEKIGLVCDEGADLPREIVEKYKISIVPFRVDFGEMKDIPGNTYQKIREAEKRGIKNFVKTSQPSPGDFLVAFKEKLEKFEEIICVTITSKHSGTFNSAIQAKNFLGETLKNKIEIIDSLSGSGGEGLLVLRAISLIEKKLKFKEIIENLREAIAKTHIIFTFEDPRWIEASGRISHFVATWLWGMQKIGVRPLLAAVKGKIKPIGIKKVKDIAPALFEEFESRISHRLKIYKDNNTIIKIVITHADNLKEAMKLRELVKKIKNTEIIFINLIGNIVGGLAGPGALALAWQEP